MKHVWLVQCYSTGQLWHTYVCATFDAAERSLRSHYGISEYYGGYSVPTSISEWRAVRNPSDHLQTATITCLGIVE